MTGRSANNRNARSKSPDSEAQLHPQSQPQPLTESPQPVTGGRGTPARPRRAAATASPKPGRIEPRPAEALTGIVGDASASGTRSGEDVRKRGWFWHWNSIVTQYAPLIGLKGVGLLNSYTVWTDRREESPHRGFAFPSQQSEADFYGEDRAELITINKILVALDLIEIRKEMVLRVDAQGRRWKVPHNLYRVKDHGDDVSLTTRDVLRVIDLADKDRAVYRYLRRLFSPRFSPIDGDNVWHRILPEVRATETWQRLAARTERDESKASARSKAGHAARPRSGREHDSTPVFSLPIGGDSATSEATAPDTDSDSDPVAWMAEEREGPTSVAPSNNGLAIDDALANTGWADSAPSSDGASNRGRATSVEPSNTTYHQSITTTTEIDSMVSNDDVRTERHTLVDRFGEEIAPDSTRSQAQAIRGFEEANDRKATAAERRQLRQIAEWAEATGFSTEVDAWQVVGSAIEEAVAAGSSFVAPKRIREIVNRWSRDGVPAEYAASVRVHAHRSGAVTDGVDGSHRMVPDVELPNGKPSGDVWHAVAQAVRSTLGAGMTRDLFTGTGIVGYEAGEVTILVANAVQYAAFAETHRDLIARKLGTALRRPVRLAVTMSDPDPDPDLDPGPGPERDRDPGRPSLSPRRERETQPAPHVQTLGAMPVFTIEQCGMTNRQVWALALADLRESGAMSRADVEAWLRDVVILDLAGREDGVAVRLGVPHVLAARRIEGRFLSPVRQALGRLLGSGSGTGVAIEVMLTRDWLRESA